MSGISGQLSLAVEALQQRRPEEAERICHQILSADPDEADAWHFLGIIAQQLGRQQAAVESFQRCVALNPADGEAFSNLGVTYRHQGQLSAARDCFQQATQIQPGFVTAHYYLALTYRDLGALNDAIASLRHTLELAPGWVEAEHQLATALRDQGNLEEAISRLLNVLVLRPDWAEAHSDLGLALQKQGRLEEALEHHRLAVALSPSSPKAHNLLGSVLQLADSLDEAEQSLCQALQLAPEYGPAWNNLGSIFKLTGRVDQAIDCYRRAVATKPDIAQAYSNLLFTIQYSAAHDASKIRQEHDQWQSQLLTRHRFSCPAFSNDTNPDRRLKVGYVSPCFCSHCQAMFTLPLFAAHDHAQFEIACYSDVLRPDEITAELQTHADVWRDTCGQSDEQLAATIQNDRIDILVDLNMHMAENRQLMFARKPAPVQVCWLAYPGTTGLSAIDYRLTDPALDPPGQTDPWYSETSVRLPDTFWCYDPLTDETPVSALPALQKGSLTFGSFNNFCKVNDQVLDLWSRVLMRIPRSRLMLLAPLGSSRERLSAHFQASGISADRLEFCAPRPRREYLELYNHVDIGLDTFPYNGHTTSLDSYWMGVPVISLVGPTVVGRAGASQLQNLGLPELIATSREQFVEIAVRLANDLHHLSTLRATLRPRLKASPLMDALRFARNIEAAYRKMWRDWCATPQPTI